MEFCWSAAVGTLLSQVNSATRHRRAVRAHPFYGHVINTKWKQSASCSLHVHVDVASIDGTSKCTFGQTSNFAILKRGTLRNTKNSKHFWHCEGEPEADVIVSNLFWIPDAVVVEVLQKKHV